MQLFFPKVPLGLTKHFSRMDKILNSKNEAIGENYIYQTNTTMKTLLQTGKTHEKELK